MQTRDEWRRYFVTIALIMINTIVFLFLFFTGRPENASFMAEHGAMYPDYIVYEKEYYRFFSSMFLHFDMRHLMSNMLLLGAAGRYGEEALGHIRFLLLYLLSGLCGSLLSFAIMFYSGETAVSAGASGAIFGLLGALLWIVLRHGGRYEKLSGRGVAGMIMLALYAGVSSTGIDNMAHLGGLIAGFVLSVLLYRRNVI